MIRSSFQRIVSHYLHISRVSLGPPNVVDTRSPCITDIEQIQTNNQNNRERERERGECYRRELKEELNLLWFSLQKPGEFMTICTAPTSIAETFAYIRKRCVRFTHAIVPIAETFGNMQKRRADSRTSRFACAGGSRQIESAGSHTCALPVAVYGHPLLRCRVLLSFSLSLLQLLFPCSKSAAS